MVWTYACQLCDVAEGIPLPVDVSDKKMMIVRISGRVFAADRTCTHEDADMSGGFVSSEGVRCPLHLSVFEMESGQPLNPPAQEPLVTYKIKIKDGVVEVEI